MHSQNDAGRVWPVLIGLALLVAILFWRVVLRGEIPVPTDLLFWSLPFSTYRPADFTGFGNALLSDVNMLMVPWHDLVWESLRQGQAPLWNPYTLSGSPLLANSQSAAFFPLTLLGAALPMVEGLRLTIPLKLVLAGVGMVLFLRRFPLPAIAVWIGAVSYAFSGYMVCWLGWSQTNVSALLPWLFWATEGLLAAGGRRWWAAHALAIACAILGGHIESTAHAFYAVALYAVWRAWTLRGGDARAFIRSGFKWAAATAIGILIAGIHLLPFAEYLFRSDIWTSRAGAPIGAGLPWWTLVLWVVPNFFGHPVHGTYNLPGLNFNEQSGYVGLGAVGLCVLAWKWSPTRGPATGLAAVGAVAAGLVYGVPGVSQLARLPGLDHSINSRFLFVVGFCIAALAAFGVGAIARRRDHAWTAVWVLVGGVLLGVTLLLAHRAGILVPGQGAFLWEPAFFRWIAGAGLWAILLALGLGLHARGWLPARPAAVLLGLAVAGDLLVFAWAYNPSVPARYVYPPNPAISFLADHAGESPVFGIGWTLPPQVNMPYHLAALGSVDGVYDRRWRAFFNTLDPSSPQDHGFYLVADRPAPGPLGVAGVRYLVAPAGEALDREKTPRLAAFRQWRQAWTDGKSTIWENPVARPRAYYAAAVSVGDEARALQAMLDPDFAAGRGAIVEEPPGHTDDGLRAVARDVTGSVARNATGRATVLARSEPEWHRPSPERIEIETNSTTSRLLVVNESFDPGWQADIDGVPARILRANAVFQALVVPAGRHRVSLAYRPLSFRLGLLASLAGGLLLALAMFFTRPADRPTSAQAMAGPIPAASREGPSLVSGGTPD